MKKHPIVLSMMSMLVFGTQLFAMQKKEKFPKQGFMLKAIAQQEKRRNNPKGSNPLTRPRTSSDIYSEMFQ